VLQRLLRVSDVLQWLLRVFDVLQRLRLGDPCTQPPAPNNMPHSKACVREHVNWWRGVGVWMFVRVCVCLRLYVYGRRRERASTRKIRYCFKHIDPCIGTHNTHMHVFAFVKLEVLSLLMSTNDGTITGGDAHTTMEQRTPIPVERESTLGTAAAEVRKHAAVTLSQPHEQVSLHEPDGSHAHERHCDTDSWINALR